MDTDVVGLVLAAGAGRRAGGPKALRRRSDGVSWIEAAVDRSLAAGCARVVVVLGADAERARALVPGAAEVVVAADWARGASASLTAGLRALSAGDAEAALVTLVDLPTATAEAGRRVLAVPADRRVALARAVHAGRPGHPVLIGRAHWAALIADLTGDSGAGRYLARHGSLAVECGDLEDGRDVDGPDADRSDAVGRDVDGPDADRPATAPH